MPAPPRTRAGTWPLALAGIALLASACGEPAGPPATVPVATPGAGAEGEGGRRPAGEVPPGSRVPFDEGTDPGKAPRGDGFEISFPGVPGTGSHYHLRVPDRGEAAAGLAGGTSSPPLLLLVRRGVPPVDGALALRDALAKEGIEAFVLDPSTAGGCGGEADHRPAGASLRSAPPARVVRCAVEARRLDAVRSAVEAAGSKGKVLERSLGGPLEGEVWVDAILLGE